MDRFYIVESICDKNTQEMRIDRTSREHIGSTVCISHRDGIAANRPCYMWYIIDNNGLPKHHTCFKTSAVKSWRQINDMLVIITEHSIYRLKEISLNDVQQ